MSVDNLLKCQVYSKVLRVTHCFLIVSRFFSLFWSTLLFLSCRGIPPRHIQGLGLATPLIEYGPD